MQKKTIKYTAILFSTLLAVILSTVIVQAEVSRPDLRIRAEAVTVNKTAPKAGDTVSISVPVENTGLANATNVPIQVFAGTAKIVDKKASAILKNGKYQLTFTWKIPVTFSGMQEFRFEADPGKTITESDETNNTALWNLSALALNVDVSIAEIPWTITPVTPIVAGTSLKVKGQVKNIGLDPTGPIVMRYSLVTYEPGNTADRALLEKELKELEAFVEKPPVGLLLDNEKQTDFFGKEEDRKARITQIRELLSAKPGAIRKLTLLVEQTVGSLSEGKFSQVSRQLTLPANYSMDKAELEITAVNRAGIAEANKANNLATAAMETRPQSVDVTIADEDMSHTPVNRILLAGQTATLRARIFNNGTAPVKSLKLSWYLSAKTQLDGSAAIATKTMTSTIPAGKSYVVTQAVKIPANVTGDRMVILQLDASNVLAESHESNNLAAHALPISAQTRDLAIDMLNPSKLSPLPGENVTWTIQVRNYGNSEVANVLLRLQPDLGNPTLDMSLTIPKLASGTAITKSFQWKVPTNLTQAVNIPIRAVVDPLNAIPEPDENNNDKLYGLTLKVPDLILANADLHLNSNNLVRGRPVTVGFTLRNTNVTTAPPSNASLLYYVIGSGSNTLIKLADLPTGILNKQQAQYFEITGMLPATLPVGTNVGLVVVADSANAILESDEGNNRAERSASMVDPPRTVKYPCFEVEVNDPQWNLLNGATVSILDKATNVTETKVTGTETFYYSVGRVIFESRPVTANYKVTVSKPGYRTFEQDFAFDNNNMDQLDLLVELDKKSILAGVVTDGANPIPGVQVKIQDTDLVTFTDNAGKYSLLMVGGSVQVKFVKAGYERVIIPVTVPPLITLIHNQTLAATTFGMVEGLITTDEGVGIQGVEIKNGGTYLGSTDLFGSFSLRLSGGNYDLRFTKSGYNGVQVNPYTVTPGMDDFLQFYLFPPSTANHVESGTGFYSWHQSVGTPANAFFIPEYNVDVWWGMGRIKMGVDVNTSSSSTKVSNLTINLTGLTWEAHKVEGSGDIEGSGINIPITIAAGGSSNLRTRIDVYRVAIESGGQEIWFDDSFWSSAQGASNSNSLVKSFSIPVASQTVTWDNNFRVKMWMRVQKMGPNTTDGEGSGALSGYHLDKKLVSWYPKKPVTTTVTSTWSAIWGYVLDAAENPLNAILSLTDLFSVQQTVNYTMEDVLPQDFPGYPPDD